MVKFINRKWQILLCEKASHQQSSKIFTFTNYSLPFGNYHNMSWGKFKKSIQPSIKHMCCMSIVISSDITLIELLLAIVNLGTVSQCIIILFNEKLRLVSKKSCNISLERLLHSLYFCNWISYASLLPIQASNSTIQKKTAKKISVKIWVSSHLYENWVVLP